MTDPRDLAPAVERILRSVRPRVLAAFGRPAGDERRKADGSVVTDLDLALDEEIAGALLDLDPSVGLASEERGVLRGGRTAWVLDPLDGSLNYSRRIPWFACQVALLDGTSPLLGAVYEPLRDDLSLAVRGGGTVREGRPVSVSRRPPEDAVVLVDVDDAGPFAEDPSRLPRLRRGAQRVRSFGSIGLHLRDVACGVADGALSGRDREQPLHDVAPGALLVREAGGLVTDALGRDALRHRRTVVAGGPSVHRFLLSVLRGAPEEGADGEGGVPVRSGPMEIVVIEFGGDIEDFPALVQTLDNRIADGDRALVVDLHSLPFINSAAIGYLIRVSRSVEEEGGELVLARVQPAIARILELTHLDDVLPAFQSVEEAVAYLGGGVAAATAAPPRVRRERFKAGP